MKLNPKTLDQIKKYFARKKGVVAVYLYGSFAKNQATKDSDIDLGVIFRQKTIKPFSSPQMIMGDEISNLIKRKVEIQDLKLCRLDFAHRVISEGELVYASNEEERIDFEEKVLREYFDLKPFLDEYYKCLAEIAQKGELNVRYL